MDYIYETDGGLGIPLKPGREFIPLRCPLPSPQNSYILWSQ